LRWAKNGAGRADWSVLTTGFHSLGTLLSALSLPVRAVDVLTARDTYLTRGDAHAIEAPTTQR
ncbi:hypothetical protein, partial [Mycobacterium marinum]|uniref:hypothetical protein n=1 Tax=Mycobacterium marinum TaxID=1781 RepID=UPI003563714A